MGTVIAGPNRRQLKVKNPEKFSWKPKELLPQLASIYLHLDRADAEGAFAKAIATSDRYRQDMFPETCQVYIKLSGLDINCTGMCYHGSLHAASVITWNMVPYSCAQVM